MKSPSFWYKLTVNMPEDQQDLVGALLFQEGSIGLENFAEKLSAYFPPEISMEMVTENLRGRLRMLGLHFRIALERIPTENWNENWKRNFKALKIGKRFLVKPSWENLSEKTDRLAITLDPGQAFGTGTHETTQLILKLMEPIAKPEMSLWDVGTGTGILAIAAAKMGLRDILANDIDPVAVRTAVENARFNHTENAIHFFAGSTGAIEGWKFDLIFMNIISRVIYELLPDIVPRLKSNGRLFLSGILAEEKSAFLEKLRRYPLQIQKIERQGEWIGLIAQKEKT